MVMSIIPADDICATLNDSYIQLQSLRDGGAKLNGPNPLDREYTSKYYIAMRYYDSLPERCKLLAERLLVIINNVNKK